MLESSEHPDPARLAHHAEAAGDRDRLLAYAVIGGSEAAGRGSHREALRLYGLAARFVDLLPLPRLRTCSRRRRARWPLPTERKTHI